MPTYTRFKNVDSVNDTTISPQLTANLISYIDWGLLNSDGFFNINTSSSGGYASAQSRLRAVQERPHSTGKVWEGFRSNWVWESGLEGNYQPTRVSGVTVNSVFYPASTTGTYAHRVDYPNGRIVFNNAISTGLVVKAAFSHKWVQVIDKEHPWFREVLHQSYAIASNYNAFGSGDRNLLAQQRFQLPAIGIEAIDNQTRSPYQIGGGEWIYQDVVFHIVAETKSDRDKLVDILSNQYEKTIFLYDINRIAESGKFPLAGNGTITSGAMCYPALVEDQAFGGFRWRRATFLNTIGNKTPQISPRLWTGSVRTTMKIDLPSQ